MGAIKKEELVRMEASLGVVAGDLTYQQRCSRVAALAKGEKWESTPQVELPRRAGIEVDPTKKLGMREAVPMHPLFGKKLLISPMLIPDKNRSLQYEETVGFEINVQEQDAGAMINNQPESVSRIVGDYDVISVNKNRPVVANSSIPKIGQEMYIVLGQGMPGVPVVKGNDGRMGYVWSFPSQVVQVEDTMIQLHGLKSLIEQVWPELLPKFSHKAASPVLMYIDGLTLAASVPMTEAIMKEHRRKELQDEKLGLS